MESTIQKNPSTSVPDVDSSMRYAKKVDDETSTVQYVFLESIQMDV